MIQMKLPRLHIMYASGDDVKITIPAGSALNAANIGIDRITSAVLPYPVKIQAFTVA